MNNLTLEEVYANATFDYLDNDSNNNTYEDYNESIETTEDFLVNLEVNFYDNENNL